MKQTGAAIMAGAILIGLGCVNIPSKIEAHITIDIRHHIEQQAASTLDFIEGKTDEMPVLEPPPVPEEGVSWLRQLREHLAPIRPAHAAEKLKDSSPLISEIAQRLRERHEKIAACKAQKHAGENNRGYLELREAGEFADDEERNETQRLIAAENKDRKALYAEIARLNKEQNVSVAMVERIYAHERLKRARPGEIFQLPPPGEAFDEFKKSPPGKRLGEDCKPGAWITIR